MKWIGLVFPVVVFITSMAAANPVAVVVEASWVYRHLDDENLVVLHVTRSPEAYLEGHIPGARRIAWNQVVVTRDGIPAEMPDADQLIRLFQRCGIDSRSRVVVYEDGPGLLAARVLVTLEYLGLAGNVGWLNGQYAGWKQAGYPVTREIVQAAHTDWEPEVNAERLISFDEIMDALDREDSSLQLIETGSPRSYEQHIPGAQNLYWRAGMLNDEPGRLLDRDELKALWASTADAAYCIPYCGAGVQASMGYVVARWLDMPVRMYDGSMSEWRKRGGPLEGVDR